MNNGSPIAEIYFYSFWKPDTLPNKNTKIVVSKLRPIGEFSDITWRLMTIKNMKYMLHRPKNGNKLPIMRLLWDVDNGVAIDYRAEQFTADSKGDVLSIKVTSGVTRSIFNGLYTQMYEHLSVILLDEETHRFITPKEFREIYR